MHLWFIHQIGSEMVQQSAEGQPVPPGRGEVGDLHPTVVLRDLAAPGQQGLAGIGFSSQNGAWDWAGLQAGGGGRVKGVMMGEKEERGRLLKCHVFKINFKKNMRGLVQHSDIHDLITAVIWDHYI